MRVQVRARRHAEEQEAAAEQAKAAALHTVEFTQAALGRATQRARSSETSLQAAERMLLVLTDEVERQRKRWVVEDGRTGDVRGGFRMAPQQQASGFAPQQTTVAALGAAAAVVMSGDSNGSGGPDKALAAEYSTSIKEMEEQARSTLAALLAEVKTNEGGGTSASTSDNKNGSSTTVVAAAGTNTSTSLAVVNVPAGEKLVRFGRALQALMHTDATRVDWSALAKLKGRQGEERKMLLLECMLEQQKLLKSEQEAATAKAQKDALEAAQVHSRYSCACAGVERSQCVLF